MKITWKHRKAEAQIEPLLQRARRANRRVLVDFPRPIVDIVSLAFPVAFESHRLLSVPRILEVLGDVYGVDTSTIDHDDVPVAGFTYAIGDSAVIFSDPQYGEAAERFTRAHEAAHLFVEYVPRLERARQGDLFGGGLDTSFYARRDPPAHFFLGDGPGTDEGTLREVVANACAAELIAPYRDVGDLLAGLAPGVDVVGAVRDRFGLSQRAAEIRLQDLGCIGGVSSTVLRLF